MTSRPAPGRIEVFRAPFGPGIRVETGVAEGDGIAAEYDSMIAKVVAWGEDRSEALARLARAVRRSQVVVRGGTTNKSFLIGLLDHPDVRSGELDTEWLDRLTATGAHLPPRARRCGAAAGRRRGLRRRRRRRAGPVLRLGGPRATARRRGARSRDSAAPWWRGLPVLREPDGTGPLPRRDRRRTRRGLRRTARPSRTAPSGRGPQLPHDLGLRRAAPPRRGGRCRAHHRSRRRQHRSSRSTGGGGVGARRAGRRRRDRRPAGGGRVDEDGDLGRGTVRGHGPQRGGPTERPGRRRRSARRGRTGRPRRRPPRSRARPLPGRPGGGIGASGRRSGPRRRPAAAVRGRPRLAARCGRGLRHADGGARAGGA